MYSADWFDTFSVTVPGEVVDREVQALARARIMPDIRSFSAGPSHKSKEVRRRFRKRWEKRT